MNDFINEEERHEAATEEPTTVGCPSLGQWKLPGGFDGVEPGEDNHGLHGLHGLPKGSDPCESVKIQSEQQREEARRKRKIVWKSYETKVDLCVMGKTQQNGKVYEVRINKRQTDVTDIYAQCKVDGKTVITCSFTGGAWMLKRILTAGMQALVNHKAKKNRNRRSRDKRIADAAKQQAHDNKAKAGEVAK